MSAVESGVAAQSTPTFAGSIPLAVGGARAANNASGALPASAVHGEGMRRASDFGAAKGRFAEQPLSKSRCLFLGGALVPTTTLKVVVFQLIWVPRRPPKGFYPALLAEFLTMRH